LSISALILRKNKRKLRRVLANLYFYTRQYGVTPDSGLENQIADLQNQVSALENQVSTLQNEKSALENEVSNLKEAKLIKVDLSGVDNRPWLQTPYLHITGCVANVGTDRASNCRLHVVFYQGSVVAEDTYIELFTIYGEGWENVDSRVYYDGEALTLWILTPEWQ